MSKPDDGNKSYQDYYNAYMKQRQIEFATGVDAVPIDVSELRRAMSLLVWEDTRFVPVIACAFADEELEELR